MEEEGEGKEAVGRGGERRTVPVEWERISEQLRAILTQFVERSSDTADSIVAEDNMRNFAFHRHGMEERMRLLCVCSSIFRVSKVRNYAHRIAPGVTKKPMG